MKKNFITEQVVRLIEKEIDDKRKLTSITNFYYFNDPILMVKGLLIGLVDLIHSQKRKLYR